MSIHGEFRMQGGMEIIYKGQKIHRCFYIDKKGKYKLKFNFVKTNSPFLQLIAIFLDGFKGKIFLDGQEIKPRRKRFPRLDFYEDTAPKDIFLDVELEDGYLAICNGSDPLGTKEITHTLSFECAMIIENYEPNKYRFICNDHEFDDDFDDLIFEMEIIE